MSRTNQSVAENYYQILGVGIRATPEEIKSAYKRLALKHHPDVNQGSKQHEELFKQVLEAYQTLSDPAKKDLYDLRLFYKVYQGNQSSAQNSAPDPAYRGVPKTRRDKEREEYFRRRPEREAYRKYTGPPIRERVTLHSFALTLLVIGSFVMLFLWLGNMMNRHTAKEHLSRGDFGAALEFDDTYGEAYFARYQYLKKITTNLPVLMRDLNNAIRYGEEPRSEWYIERAAVYFKMDSLDKTKQDLMTARFINPASDTAAFYLGDLFSDVLQNKQKALSYYDTTIQINPKFYPARYGKAFMLFQLKRLPQALSAFNDCMKMAPEDKRLYYYRGSISLALGDSVAACTDLDQSLTMGMDEAKPLVDSYCSKVSIRYQP